MFLEDRHGSFGSTGRNRLAIANEPFGRHQAQSSRNRILTSPGEHHADRYALEGHAFSRDQHDAKDGLHPVGSDGDPWNQEEEENGSAAEGSEWDNDPCELPAEASGWDGLHWKRPGSGPLGWRMFNAGEASRSTIQRASALRQDSSDGSSSKSWLLNRRLAPKISRSNPSPSLRTIPRIRIAPRRGRG